MPEENKVSKAQQKAVNKYVKFMIYFSYGGENKPISTAFYYT